MMSFMTWSSAAVQKNGHAAAPPRRRGRVQRLQRLGGLRRRADPGAATGSAGDRGRCLGARGGAGGAAGSAAGGDHGVPGVPRTAAQGDAGGEGGDGAGATDPGSRSTGSGGHWQCQLRCLDWKGHCGERLGVVYVRSFGDVFLWSLSLLHLSNSIHMHTAYNYPRIEWHTHT